MISYDPQVLVQQAQRLYREAKYIILRQALLGLVLGSVMGAFCGAVLGGVVGDAEALFAFIGIATLTPLFTAVGVSMGVRAPSGSSWKRSRRCARFRSR